MKTLIYLIIHIFINVFKIYSYVYNLNFFILIRVLKRDIVLVKGFEFF